MADLLLRGADVDLAAARERLERQVADPATGDGAELAAALEQLADVARRQRNIERARAACARALALRQRLGDRAAEARLLGEGAYLAIAEGDYPNGQRLAEQSLALGQALGDSATMARALNLLCDVSRNHGQADEARAHYEASLALWRAAADRRAVADTLLDVASAARAQGQPTAARSLLTEALPQLRELAEARPLARFLEAAAALTVDEEADEDALRLAGAADALRASSGVPMAPTERVRLEAVLAPAYRRLGADAADRARAAGRALPLEDALAEAARR